jgi:hypothetical protein
MSFLMLLSADVPIHQRTWHHGITTTWIDQEGANHS